MWSRFARTRNRCWGWGLLSDRGEVGLHKHKKLVVVVAEKIDRDRDVSATTPVTHLLQAWVKAVRKLAQVWSDAVGIRLGIRGTCCELPPEHPGNPEDFRTGFRVCICEENACNIHSAGTGRRPRFGWSWRDLYLAFPVRSRCLSVL